MKSSHVGHASTELPSDTIPLAHNLKIALRHLRPSSGPPRRLWIDAICINQANSFEKNIQVPLIGDIFDASSQTLIWLGPESGDSTLALRFIDEIYARWHNGGREHRAAMAMWLNTTGNNRWRALSKLMARLWWGRLWVIQETVRGHNGLVLCGQHHLPLHKFICLDEVRLELDDLLLTDCRPATHPFSRLFTEPQLRHIMRGGNLDLLTWLQITDQSLCSQKRDRLYALLGLCSLADRAAIPVVYDESRLPDHCLQFGVTVYFLRKYKTLQVLTLCWRKRTPGIPSWVSDWSAMQAGRQRFVSDDIGDYHACGQYRRPPLVSDQQSQATTFPTALPTEERVITEGWIVDKIVFADAFPYFGDEINKPYEGLSGPKPILDAIEAKVPAWWDAVQKLGRSNWYISDRSKSRWDAFWRTLTSNNASTLTGLPDHVFRHKLKTLAERTERAGNIWLGNANKLSDLFVWFHQRSFVITQRGFLGLAPARGGATTQVGDLVCVLATATTPIVLREKEKKSFH